MKLRALRSIWFLSLLVITSRDAALASGGPLELPPLLCTSAAGSKTSGALLFRLVEAYSSEVQGDLLVYRDAAQRETMLSSMPHCLELTAVTLEPRLPEGVNANVICGVWTAPQQGKGKLTANSAGYLGVLEKARDRSRGYLLRRSGGTWETLLLSSNCVEETRGR